MVCVKCGSDDLSRPTAQYCRACKKEIDANSYQRHRDARRQKRKDDRVDHREWIDSLKTDPCADCGQTYPACVMEFHHRDPADKKFNIGDMRKRVYSKSRVLAEIAKCDLLCANCHRIREYVPA